LAAVEIDRVVQLWPAVVDHVREAGSAMLSSLFDSARPLGVDSEKSVLRVGFPSSAKFNKRKAEAKANVERVSEAVEAVVGHRLRPVYELVDGEEHAEGGTDPAPELAEEEIIEMIKTNFDAREVVPDEAPGGEETA